MLERIAEPLTDEQGRYRIIAKIGQGGMADVFLALVQGASGFNKLVVLKVVREILIEDPDAAAMFVDEARLAGRLNHPNVVQTLEVTEIAGRPSMVLEYLEGHSLIEILRECQARNLLLPLPIALRIVCESLEGLRYAHELTDFDRSPLRLVHRDVSPQNLFVTYDGQIKVLDFGIAKAAISVSETRAGMFKGKVAYMAPEQILGERIDQRADIYAMGAVLWFVATGQRLWKSVPEGQTLVRVMRGDVPTPSSVNPDVPPELERICMKALSPSLAGRYQDAEALQKDVDAYLTSLGKKATARHVGEFVSNLFGREREVRERIIQKQLAEVKLESPGAESSESDTHQGLATTASTTGPVIAASRLSGADIFPARPPSAKRWALIAVAAAGVVVLFIAATLTRSADTPVITPQSSPPSAAHTETASTSPPTVEPAPSAAPAVHEADAPWLEIKTVPENVRVFCDDFELRTRPARVRLEPKGSTHTVRVEAPGYRSKSVEVVAGEKERIVVDLIPWGRGAPEAKPTPPEEAPPPVATASEPPEAPTQPEKGARDRIKELDTSSPW